mmetsp:Transcript_16404/g.29716  ORF Transcript_16404/g.29716 Transcript_16404/m.29716 type:complete len:276 (-) Transcript_16404:199-1026(-)
MPSRLLLASSAENAVPMRIDSRGTRYVRRPPLSERSEAPLKRPPMKLVTSATEPSLSGSPSSADAPASSCAPLALGRKDSGSSPGFSLEVRRPGATCRMISYPLPNLSLRCCGVPRMRSWPLTMMPMRVHSASASSIEWVVKTTLREAMVLMITSHRLRRETGSSPADGSSSSTTFGSPMSAMATQSFRFMPPLSCMASLCAYGSSSISRSVARTSGFTYLSGTPRRRAKSLRWSTHVRRSHSVLCCVTTPRWLEAPRKLLKTESPHTWISPVVG